MGKLIDIDGLGYFKEQMTQLIPTTVSQLEDAEALGNAINTANTNASSAMSGVSFLGNLLHNYVTLTAFNNALGNVETLLRSVLLLLGTGTI